MESVFQYILFLIHIYILKFSTRKLKAFNTEYVKQMKFVMPNLNNYAMHLYIYIYSRFSVLSFVKHKGW